jgi:hypothetical protein
MIFDVVAGFVLRFEAAMGVGGAWQACVLGLAYVAFFVVHESLSVLSAVPYAWLLRHAVGQSWFSGRCGTVEFVITTLFIVQILL